MQLVQRNGTRQDKYSSGTYDSITINALLRHANLNTALAVSDFDPAQVSVKVILKRNGSSHVIMQDNLLILGAFAGMRKNMHEFINGIDKIYPAADKNAVKLRTVTIPFGGHVRLDSAKMDVLIAEVSIGGSVYTANINASESNFEFYLNSSIGYETGIPSIVSEVVQTNATKQSFNPGDNITQLVYLNFDKQTCEDEIITNCNIQSDRLDESFTFNQLLAHHAKQYDQHPLERFGTSLPVGGVGTAFRGLDYWPQSFVLFDGHKIQNELDNLKVEFSFNRGNVNSSQNYLVWMRYETDAATIIEAKERETKHINEKIDKINGK